MVDLLMLAPVADLEDASAVEGLALTQESSSRQLPDPALDERRCDVGVMRVKTREEFASLGSEQSLIVGLGDAQHERVAGVARDLRELAIGRQLRLERAGPSH